MKVLKTALITGASGKIGRALVKKFLDNGYFVLCHYSKDTGGISILKDEILSANYTDKVAYFKADFSDLNAVENMYKDIEKTYGGVDLLVNNAGVDLIGFADATLKEDLIRVFNVNFHSAFLLSKLALPKMISNKSGNIINISSVWGIAGASMESVYSASKSALIGLTKSLAKELAPSGIRVNCICPGVIDTPMNDCFSTEEKAQIVSEIPLGRMGTAEDVSSLAGFIASDKASYITGQILTVDGGYIL